MKKSNSDLNYIRIAKAINLIKDYSHQQPDLSAIADVLSLSPFHFQRIFKEWAGVTPKQFLQYLNAEYAKRILRETRVSILDTACQRGLSGTRRLHDLFISIEVMTPGEYNNGGENISLNYSFAYTPFGDIIIASTPKGICSMEFADSHVQAFKALQRKFPRATFTRQYDSMQHNALSIFSQDWSRLRDIKLHLKGTEFQLKVWETLLKIPMGGLSTYGEIAGLIENPQACRAVGHAVADNPVAFLIPCHRVIRASGDLGNYHWGETRKKAIIGWELAIQDKCLP